MTEDEKEDVALDAMDAKQYRALAARCMYLSFDRPETQFAVKECCRGMAHPTQEDLTRIKRIARYSKGVPRMVFFWPFHWSRKVFGAPVPAHLRDSK